MNHSIETKRIHTYELLVLTRAATLLGGALEVATSPCLETGEMAVKAETLAAKKAVAAINFMVERG